MNSLKVFNFHQLHYSIIIL